MNTNDPSKGISRIFTWIAWLLFIGLLVWVFQGTLDNQHNPNQQPKSSLNQQGHAQVTLIRNKFGHYVTAGRINDTTVTFLLDTGATNVSIPIHIARHLMLPELGSHYAETANGTIKVYKTVLDKLSIGPIILYNVAASINPGMESDEILLGMSALKQLEFRQTGKYLYLTEQAY